MENLLFYDIEVFKEDALVVFKDIEKNIVKIFHNNFTGVSDLIKDKTLVGYNNYWYDDKILTYMIDGKDVYQIKRLNDDIIAGETYMKVSSEINSLDCFQQIDVGRPSLKKIEGNIGLKIKESDIDFNIDRKLTDEELQEVIEYCCYDVDVTIDVYKLRIKSYFETKQELLKMCNGKASIRWNTTTLSANALLDKPLPKWYDIRLKKDNEDFEDLLSIVHPDVVEMWRTKDKGKVVVEAFDNIIEFGFGGLHGVHKSIKKVENVKMLDVASMYPNIILNINALGNYTEKYKDILNKRIAVKHTDKVLSDTLKLILNSVYGNLKNEYSSLYNPKSALSVCIYGQIALYRLCEMLAPYCTIININTDGVAFTTDNEEYKTIWKLWEKEFNLTLEEDTFDLFIQKDVNNYIGIKDGKLKCKGGDTNRYHADAMFKNNNARILDIALVNKLVYNKDVLDTLMENLDDPKLYQYILQAGSTYLGTYDKDGNKYQKINRVFASKDGDFTLYKKRKDGGLVKFPDTPEKMTLWNDDCKDFKGEIDINHYYQIVQKKLERWV